MTTKTATKFLCDLLRYKDNRMTKKELNAAWAGHKWSSEGLAAWARFYWMENVK